MITLADIQATGLPITEHDAIAAQLSQGRTRVQPNTMIGTGTILAVFGGHGGEFLDALQAAGAQNRDLYWLLTGNILRGEFDVGNATSRAGMQALAQAMPMFAGGIEALLNLAVVPDPVTPLEVVRSIEQGV